jgi:hypothetical protein
MYSYSKLTSKYSITLLECRPNGPEYIMCPPVFRRISCKREKRHELNNSSRLHNKKNIAYTTLFFIFTFWIWNEPHKFIYTMVAPQQSTLFPPLHPKSKLPRLFLYLISSHACTTEINSTSRSNRIASSWF